MAVIAWSVQNLWLSIGTVGAVFLFAFVMLWRLINFADRHPQAALLEGAEFLVLEQIVHASKSIPIFPVSATEPAQPEEIEGPSASPELAQVPDQEIQGIENGGGRQ